MLEKYSTAVDGNKLVVIILRREAGLGAITSTARQPSRSFLPAEGLIS